MGNDPHCMMGWRNEPKLLFLGPQVACLCLSAFFMFVACLDYATAPIRFKNSASRIRTLVWAFAVIFILYATGWISGCLFYIRWFQKDITNYYPLFAILNAFSGVFMVTILGFTCDKFKRSLKRLYLRVRK